MYPLLAAYNNRQIDAMELLLINGADYNRRSNRSHSDPRCGFIVDELIDIAILDQYTEGVELLLRYGAYLYGGIIDAAFKHLSSDIIKALLPYMTEDQIEPYLRTAIEYGDDRVLIALLEYGISPDIYIDSTPALIIALNSGYKSIIDLLFKHDASPNITDANGSTALHIVSRLGDMEMVKYLLSKGANVNAVDHIGNSPLHLASLYKRTGVIEHLSTNGADNTISNTMGITPKQAIYPAHASMMVPVLSEDSS